MCVLEVPGIFYLLHLDKNHIVIVVILFGFISHVMHVTMTCVNALLWQKAFPYATKFGFDNYWKVWRGPSIVQVIFFKW